MNESFRRVIRHLIPGATITGQIRSPHSGAWFAYRLIGAGILIVLALAGGNVLLRRSDRAIEIHRRPSGLAATLMSQSPLTSKLRSPAPSDGDDVDAGVAEAARHVAMTLVTPELKQPDTAAFPVDAIRWERLGIMNRMTDGAIEHWLVDGAVDSRNDYGYDVRSNWRIVLARDTASFFPVLASLEGVEIYYLRSHPDLLTEARKDALQKRQADANEKKSRSLAEKRAVWQAIDSIKPAEAKAQAALQLATDLLKAGRTDPARRRLQEVIDNFPDTDAAAQAAELLKK
jgi:hypothetical protein